MNCIDKLNQISMRELLPEVPQIRTGSLVRVSQINEKKNSLLFEGILIAQQGSQINKSLLIYSDKDKIKKRFFLYDPRFKYQFTNPLNKKYHKAKLYYLSK